MNGLFSFFLLIFSSFPVFALDDPCQAQQCVGVVDVGSTGSRLYLYSYDRDDAGYPVRIQEQWSKKVTPGLATLESKQETIDAYLDGLFSTKINTKIPVYVYATAGMRLLSTTKQQEYYHAVETWFDRHSTSWTLSEARTLTGKEEGVYDWLAVNYQLDLLSPQSTEQVGVMDMGGASVEIVFPVTTPVTVPSSWIETVTLYGKTYTLYSYSALGLGQTLVSQQFLNHRACFPKDYLLADHALGLGDASSCVRDITHLINDVHHVADEVNPLLYQHVRDWYALGGMAYLPKYETLNLNATFTPDQLFRTTEQKACLRPWSEVEADLSNVGGMACLMGSYYYALMVEGYGMSTKETLHVMSDVGWTLGVVLSL